MNDRSNLGHRLSNAYVLLLLEAGIYQYEEVAFRVYLALGYKCISS